MSGVQGQNRMTICPIQGDIKTIVRSFFFCMSSSSSPPPLPAGGDISAVSLLERQAHDEHLPPGAATRWQSCLLVEGQSGPPQHAGRLSVCALPVLALGLGHLGRHKFCIKKKPNYFYSICPIPYKYARIIQNPFGYFKYSDPSFSSIS